MSSVQANNRPMIPLKVIEEVLYNENTCVAENDVPALMLVLARMAPPYNTDAGKAAELAAFTKELEEQTANGEEAQK